MVGVLHQVHSIKYTVDTCTGMPQNNIGTRVTSVDCNLAEGDF